MPCMGHNMPPNLEVGKHLHQVNTTRNRVAGGQDQRADAADAVGGTFFMADPDLI